METFQAVTFVVGALWAAAISLGLLFGGLLLITLSIIDHGLVFGDLVPTVLKGLELIFLSPLVFLSYITLFRLCQHWIEWLRGSDRVRGTGSAEEAKRLEGDRAVDRLKVMIASLMVALLITDMISKIFSGSPQADSRLLAEALAGSLSIAFYFIAVRHTSHAD
jgi:hypothetical protein